MIILSENPLDDISNTKKVEAVINNGQLIELTTFSEFRISIIIFI
jgi:hypothetical protein